MVQLSASAAFMAIVTASRLSTGSAPGSPRQTGQVFELGGSPKRVEHAQNALVSVLSCTWTSRPMTGSYCASTSGEIPADSCVPFAIPKPELYHSPKAHPAVEKVKSLEEPLRNRR